MLTLKKDPNLATVQTYVKQLEQERGFSANPIQQECLLLGEEIGELFKAIRKHERMQIDATSKIGTPTEELADILIYLCAIANRLDIDLETALREKEEINKQRVWKAA